MRLIYRKLENTFHLAKEVFNPLQPRVTFVYSLKTSENLKSP